MTIARKLSLLAIISVQYILKQSFVHNYSTSMQNMGSLY